SKSAKFTSKSAKLTSKRENSPVKVRNSRVKVRKLSVQYEFTSKTAKKAPWAVPLMGAGSFLFGLELLCAFSN
ncbi:MULTISPECIES: hypothetical protein, partial [unclassified Bacillus (in: firmicutes)]|uniref:hypothetical protein n=1 Tax=unclassified Bacillus (in: firmicutes) TaxID=185979 RepID=UPI0006629284